MLTDLKKRIKKFNKNGSYITEAAITLPVLIIAVCALALIIRIVAVCESICFVTANEVRETSLEAYNKIPSVSLCKSIETEVLKTEKSLTDFRVTKHSYLYQENGTDDLICVCERARFEVSNPIGINGEISFDLKLKARAFTGSLREEEPLYGEKFRNNEDSCEVVVFPKYGIRFHRMTCRYVKFYDEEGSCKLIMEKEDALLKGFTACKVCGGAAND